VRSHGAAVLVAPPGAGKTTRVPRTLVVDGPVLLLQPRRVAARSLARRIAEESGWTLGEEIGWQVRFERRFSARTRLLVATEGVVTARLQRDPLLSGFRTVVLDEFHERSLHADLALALLREAREARDDLRIVVMSATIDPGPVAAFLGDCPVIEIAGRAHPLQIEYAPHEGIADAVLRILKRDPDPRRNLLCFLPGAPEIEEASRELRPRLPAGCELFPLYGALDSAAQDRALAPSSSRKIILATNIAETSLTVDGAADVVDSGLQKVLRRDSASGIDRLETERISRDSADQRAGRAGRTGPGCVLRLWNERDELRAHREPEIRRVDLAAPLLDVLAWGADPETFRWFERPPEVGMSGALDLLERLGAIRERRVTPLGRALSRIPAHPRLGRLLLGCGATSRAAAACAVLDCGWRLPEVDETTTCDLLPLVDRLDRAPRRVRAYPDRVAQRRQRGSPRLKLAGGHGAVLARESGVRDGEFLVAVEMRASKRGAGAEARVARAARIYAEWLEPTGSEIVHELEPDGWRVRATERVMFESLILGERAAAIDMETAAVLRRDALLKRGLDARTEARLRRLRFAGIEVDVPTILLEACRGPSRAAVDPLAALDWRQLRRLRQCAPEKLVVPSGRAVALDYRDDGSVLAAVKLQELFGLGDSPRLGPGKDVPVTFALLAPNGRPVQTTSDLRSFWNGAYAEVRKELRGRYPRHPWPEDPWSAEPAKPR